MKQNAQEKKSTPAKRKQPFFSFVKRILRLFFKRPRIIHFGEGIGQPSIVLCNHISLKGPMINELYLPVPTIKWGAGEMLGNYKMRYRYLHDVYYRQKMGYGPVKATLLAAFSATFSKYFYKGMNVIPTWRDGRLINTVRRSIAVLKGGASVLIFPENSNEGYKDILTEFHAGFVTLAECYYQKTKQDIPVYPVYYHHKKKVLAIGAPMYVQDLVKQGLSRAQIAERFRNIVNNLYQKVQTLSPHGC